MQCPAPSPRFRAVPPAHAPCGSCSHFLPDRTAMRWRDIHIEPVTDRFKPILRKIAFQQAPHTRLERLVSVLAIALPQSAEYAENAGVALRRKCPICGLEPVIGSGQGDIA